MASKAITTPPKGTRDFLPGDVRRREHVLAKVRSVYSRYGFEPLETPAMERLDALLGKYGEEGDQLIFRILQRGAELGRALDKVRAAPVGTTPEEGRATFKRNEGELADMALRYDLTVPLARVVAEHQAVLPRFFKRFQIQPVWRADRPAQGRFREFYQCDVDVVGSSDLACDVEVVSAVCEVLDALGFNDYRVRLNHRALLSGLVEEAGIPAALEVHAITALDKLDKVGADGVRAELAERGIEAGAAARFLEVVQSLSGATLPTLKSEAGQRGLRELETVRRYAADAPGGRRLQLDATLARGLSYYTGPIFEIQVPDLAGSLGGGGRYDNLIGMFLGRPIPAVGFSLGLERILVVMEERKMFPALDAAAPVMVFRLEEETTGLALKLATTLRAAGIATDLYGSVDKLGKQFQYATSRGVKVAVFAGAKERDAGQVALKRLETQEQVSVSLDQLVATARGWL
jgi:histidyl-tRNA synthetase